MKISFTEYYLLQQIFEIGAADIRLHSSASGQEGRHFIEVGERGFKIVD